MGNPYSGPTISGYNSNPPADDGSQTSPNALKWSKHIAKIGDPLKTYAQAVNSAVSSAFGKIFGANVSQKSDDYTIATTDQGKFITQSVASKTFTLLAAADAGQGFAVCLVNLSTGILTIDANSSETINGDVTQILGQGEMAILTCNSSAWTALITRIFGNTVQTKTGDYTVVASDKNSVIEASGSLSTVNLLPAATAGDGFPITVVNNTGSTITVDGNASELINGSTSISLLDGDAVILFSNGSYWVAHTALVSFASTADTITGTATTASVTPAGLANTIFAYRYDGESFAEIDGNAGADGWSVADASEVGLADITHNLGLSSINDLIVTATSSQEGAGSPTTTSHALCQIQDEGVNGFSVQATGSDGNRLEIGAVNIIAYKVA